MIRWRIQIAQGEMADIFAKWGLIPLSIDNRLAAPLKSQDVTSYAGQSGENVDSRAVKAAFDFKAKFAVYTHGGKKATTLIKAFNDAILVRRAGTDIYDKQVVALYDHKSRKIVGLAQPLGEEPEKFVKVNGEQFAVVELTLRVTDPEACSFDVASAVGEMAIGQDFIIN